MESQQILTKLYQGRKRKHVSCDVYGIFLVYIIFVQDSMDVTRKNRDKNKQIDITRQIKNEII